MDTSTEFMHNLTMADNLSSPIERVASSLILTSTGHYTNAPIQEMYREAPVDALVIWVVSGRGYAETNDVAKEVSTGDLLVFEPGQPQLYRPDHDDPWEIFWVHFMGRRARAYLDALRCYAQPFAHLGLNTDLRESFDDLIIHASENPDLFSRTDPKPDVLAGHLLAALLGRMLHLLGRERAAIANASPNFDTAAIRRYINRHLTEPLTLDELADHMHVSATHFSRLFRQQFGQSPMHYVIQQRMARAAAMLVETQAAVKQVAYSVGYDDPYHFSRLFKKHLGKSPAAWRKQSRREPAV